MKVVHCLLVFIMGALTAKHGLATDWTGICIDLILAAGNGTILCLGEQN